MEKEAKAYYLNSFQRLCSKANARDLEFLESGLSVSELNAKHYYIHANALQHQIGFVYKGLVRSYYVDANGDDITVKFIRENSYATDYTAFIGRTPSKYYFQCIEPTVFVNLSYDHIQEGYDRFPTIERYGRLIAEQVLVLQQKRIEGFLFETAEERYLDFINENPDLFNRVSLSHLSTYLGIERQSLTRIRKKIGHT